MNKIGTLKIISQKISTLMFLKNYKMKKSFRNTQTLCTISLPRPADWCVLVWKEQERHVYAKSWLRTTVGAYLPPRMTKITSRNKKSILTRHLTKHFDYLQQLNETKDKQN